MAKFDWKRYKYVIIIGAAAILLLMAFANKGSGKTPAAVASATWEVDLERMADTQAVDVLYLRDDSYLVYSDAIISGPADQLAAGSFSAKEYVEKVLDYVYSNVKYNGAEPDAECLYGDAVKVLNRGTGQCDTQSMVVTAMLRRHHIPARIIGGCIVQKPSCGGLMAAVTLIPQPVYRPVALNVTTFSRGANLATLGRSGSGLHAWPQVMLPVGNALEWYTLEATAGRFGNIDCYGYYPEVERIVNQRDICVTSNRDFALACANQNFDVLNTFGGAYTQ
jgi:transglutaminase-like putative cysteine protease